MNDIDLFLELPVTAQAAVVCFVICATCLFVILLFAPRRDCFFLRWRPEKKPTQCTMEQVTAGAKLKRAS